MERKIITGIYGGSFNPIHRGHVCLAKALAETEFVDEIWLLVSPQNPFKVDDCLLDDALRLRLTRMAVAHEPKVEVCDREFTLPRPSYMYNTLTALSQEHPDREFVLVIGADNWERIRFLPFHQPDRQCLLDLKELQPHICPKKYQEQKKQSF